MEKEMLCPKCGKKMSLVAAGYYCMKDDYVIDPITGKPPVNPIQVTFTPLTKGRPTGILVIAVILTLFSIYNIYQSLNLIIGDLGFLPVLSDPRTPEWLSFGLPAEIMIGFFVLAYGFLTLIVVYGLLTARSWSYHFALALPIFITILNFATMLLYLSAPSELELAQAGFDAAPFIVGNIIFMIIIWGYLTRPHVKHYLKGMPAPSAPAPRLPPPPPPSLLASPEESKFCRYCGFNNKTDAIFCEKCGKKIG